LSPDPNRENLSDSQELQISNESKISKVSDKESTAQIYDNFYDLSTPKKNANQINPVVPILDINSITDNTLPPIDNPQKSKSATKLGTSKTLAEKPSHFPFTDQKRFPSNASMNRNSPLSAKLPVINEKMSDVESDQTEHEDSEIFTQAIIAPIPVRCNNIRRLEKVIGSEPISPTAKVRNSSSSSVEHDLSVEDIRHDKIKFSDMVKK
jgi:hypothetical protein